MLPFNNTPEKKRILVVGAGVVGLTCALKISDSLKDKCEIEVIAKDLPGDNSLFYTSPKAGAHWISTNDKTWAKAWHLETYQKLKELSKIPESFIKPFTLYMGEIVPAGKQVPEYVEPWFKDKVDDFEFVDQDQKKFPDVYNIYKFTSFTISTSFYLNYLVAELQKRGVSIRRHTLKSLKDSEDYEFSSNNGKPDLIINSTGYQYNLLNDCFDPKLKPIRGHVIVVENNLPYQVSFEEPYPAEEGEFLMIFPRKEGGAIIGGIYDRHSLSFDTSIHKDYVERLKLKLKKHVPEFDEKLKISAHTIGFRPDRQGGARIEIDKFNSKIIHNYGNGNSGYIESWGCANFTLSLVNKVLYPKAKL